MIVSVRQNKSQRKKKHIIFNETKPTKLPPHEGLHVHQTIKSTELCTIILNLSSALPLASSLCNGRFTSFCSTVCFAFLFRTGKGVLFFFSLLLLFYMLNPTHTLARKSSK